MHSLKTKWIERPETTRTPENIVAAVADVDRAASPPRSARVSALRRYFGSNDEKNFAHRRTSLNYTNENRIWQHGMKLQHVVSQDAFPRSTDFPDREDVAGPCYGDITSVLKSRNIVLEPLKNSRKPRTKRSSSGFHDMCWKLSARHTWPQHLDDIIFKAQSENKPLPPLTLTCFQWIHCVLYISLEFAQETWDSILLPGIGENGRRFTLRRDRVITSNDNND